MSIRTTITIATAVAIMSAAGLVTGASSADLVHAASSPAAADVVTVDETSPGFRRVGGDWRTASGGYDDSHDWLPTRQNLRHIGIWNADLEASGHFKVLASIPEQHSGTRAALYKIKTVDGWARMTRSQDKHRGGWLSLGIHELPAVAEVRLTDKTRDPVGSTRKLSFDAIRFVSVAPPPPAIKGMSVEPKDTRAIVSFDLGAAGFTRTDHRPKGSDDWRLGAEGSGQRGANRNVVTGLDPERDYQFRVVAKNESGKATKFRTATTTPREVDCGAGDDLQDAIDEAASGATILIDGTCKGSFEVEDDLILRGRSGGRLDGGGSGTMLAIPEFPGGRDIELVSLTLRNADTCVLSEQKNGLVSIADSTVTDCGVGLYLADGAGGRISGSRLHQNDTAVFGGMQAGARITGSVVEDNSIGVESLGAATIIDSTIRRNGPGGGVRVWQYLTVRGSRINWNEGPNGGGIYVGELDSDLLIEDSIIRGNEATSDGGGIYRNVGRNTMVDTVLRDVEIRDNVAAGVGGGLFNEDPGVDLRRVTFANNQPDACTGC